MMECGVIKLAGLAVALQLANTAVATENEIEKLTVEPVATLLLDGAAFGGEVQREFPAGFAIPEARLGFIASIGKWKAKIEAGHSYNKLLLKDVWFQYGFDGENSIRAGFMVHQFGIQNATAACQKITMIEPECNTIFNEPQRLGVQYLHSDSLLFATASLYTEGAATTTTLGGEGMSRESMGLKSRLVIHPNPDINRGIVQIGLSGAFETPHYAHRQDDDPHDRFSFVSNYPTRVANVTALSATIDRSRNLWKLSPEVFLAKQRLALESQYYYMRVNRLDNLHHYRASGAYALIRGVILGGNYDYSTQLAGIATPRKGTLEGVICWNYTDLCDNSVGIHGGRLSDWSATLNYHINKYMTARLRAGYVTVSHSEEGLNGGLASLQARLQIIF